MDATSWLKQADEPLFADLLWSRPQNKRSAGKLLIVGGNSHSFSAVNSAHASALKAGIGTARVLLPDSLQKSLGKAFAEAEFAPSTPSGSFSREALAQFLDSSAWADGVLLTGDFGKNSETSILLENFLAKDEGLVTVSGDTSNYFFNDPTAILDRPKTIVVADFSSLQKLLAGRLLIKHSMNLAQIVEAFVKFSSNCPSALLTFYSGQILVAVGGKLSTTAAQNADLTQLAAYAATWQIQQPAKIFETLTCAAYCAVHES